LVEARAPEVRFGRGALDDLTAALAGSGAARPAIVCTPSQRFVDRLPIGAPVIATAAEHGPMAVLEAALAALAALTDIDALVAIGGGTAIGLGKALAARTGLPLIAVPTTFAGSALTESFGISENRWKRVERSPDARPRAAIYDPALFDDFCGVAAAASAFNALAHAVDALSTEAAAPEQGRRAIRALAAGLPRLPDSPVADAMIAGAIDAGQCLAAMSAPGPHHRLCHAIGGQWKTHHGLTHAILLPHSVMWLGQRNPKAHAVIADALETPTPAVRLQQLGQRCGISGGLRALGVPLTGLANLREFAPDALLQAAWAG
jgi:maleylacetate reductase